MRGLVLHVLVGWSVDCYAGAPVPVAAGQRRSSEDECASSLFASPSHSSPFSELSHSSQTESYMYYNDPPPPDNNITQP